MRKIGIAFLFAAMAVMGCSSDSGGSAGSGGTAGTGGTAGSGGSGGVGGGGGEAGAGGMAGMGGEGGAGGGGGVAFYEENFEELEQQNPDALGNAGWIVFGNVLDPDSGEVIASYGTFPAPNNSGGFCGIDIGQGGAEQGEQQLVIISDYNNRTEQEAGNLVEANTFREFTVEADQVGATLTYSFDAKRGNINDPTDDKCPCTSTANAFIKTLDPDNNFALIDFEEVDTTDLPTEWMRYELTLEIREDLEGKLLQFGYSATATNDEPSGVFYDNVLVVIE